MANVVLCILDGWGYRKNGADNAIRAAKTRHWDGLWESSPHTLLEASSHAVGLPEGQMGNSEVGHMNIGAGRVVLQDLPRIHKAIDDKSIPELKAYQDFVAKLKASKGTCHLLGLLSPGGIHSHQDHLLALAEILNHDGIPVIFHPFLDGRDTPPQSARAYLEALHDFCGAHPLSSIGTLGGRFYAMDRDNRWERVEKAYRAMISPAIAAHAPESPFLILEKSYEGRIYDEFIEPVGLKGYKGMKDGDGILMANFRADRAREILTALLDPEFTHFSHPPRPHFAAALGMAEYSEDLNGRMETLFPSETPSLTLGEVVASHHLKQLRTAETEKYAHVTFFFNGGREDPFPGEERILVPSPKVETYDLKPEMSAVELTDGVVGAIESGQFPLIVVNYANPDMVGHTGNFEATVKAIETVDACLGRIRKALEKTHGTLIITADHGNAEVMENTEVGGPHTAHTTNEVPFVLHPIPPGFSLKKEGCLADIAPTVLTLLDLPIPGLMTGTPLLTRTL